MRNNNAKYINVITFKEFEELADEVHLIFPYNYEKMSKLTLGIISDNTFYPIEFSYEAEKTLR